jgi:hypothetical protein
MSAKPTSPRRSRGLASEARRRARNVVVFQFLIFNGIVKNWEVVVFNYQIYHGILKNSEVEVFHCLLV